MIKRKTRKLSIGIFGILLFYCLNTFAVGTVQDSLILLENINGRDLVINSKQNVKAWLHDKTKVDGYFKMINENELTIIKDSEEIIIPIREIKNLRFYNSKRNRILGLVLIIIGAITLFIGSFFAYIIFIGLAGGRDAVIPSYLLPAQGIGLMILGIKLKGRKFNLKKWRIRDF